jgi:hypothetical protein
MYDIPKNIYLPYIIIPNGDIRTYVPIANLHIHSKNLHRFVALHPKENDRFIKISPASTKHDLLLTQYLLFNTYDQVNIEYIQKYNIVVYGPFQIEDTITENIMLEEIVWTYDKNNLRIPTNITAYKLNHSDNIYDFISSNRMIDCVSIITGERIQQYADVVIGSRSSLQYNPYNVLYSENLKHIDNNNIVNEYNTIFCFAHDWPQFYNKWKDALNDKIIITRRIS